MSSEVRLADLPPMESTLRHRRETFWQITFPVIVVALIFIGLLVALRVIFGPVGVSVAADYSLILIITSVCFLNLLTFAVFAGLIYAFIWAIPKIPPYTNAVQRGATTMYQGVDKGMHFVTSISIGALAALGGFSNALQKWGLVPNGDESKSSEPTAQ